VHNGQRKSNLKRKKKALGLSGLERLLEIAGLEVTTKGVRTGTRSESRVQRVPEYRGCSVETVGD